MNPEPLARDEVLRVARLARLGLSEAQIEAARVSLASIMGPIEKLKELDVEAIAPLAAPPVLAGGAREDLVVPGLSVDEALHMAPERLGDGFGVPKIIE